jgi:hypothetical protein
METRIALLGFQIAGVVPVGTLIVAVKDHVAGCGAGTDKKFHGVPPLVSG